MKKALKSRKFAECIPVLALQFFIIVLILWVNNRLKTEVGTITEYRMTVSGWVVTKSNNINNDDEFLL